MWYHTTIRGACACRMHAKTGAYHPVHIPLELPDNGHTGGGGHGDGDGGQGVPCSACCSHRLTEGCRRSSREFVVVTALESQYGVLCCVALLVVKGDRANGGTPLRCHAPHYTSVLHRHHGQVSYCTTISTLADGMPARLPRNHGRHTYLVDVPSGCPR